MGQETGQFVFGVELGEVHWVEVLCEVVLILRISIAFGCKEVLDLLGQRSWRFVFSDRMFKSFRRTAITVSIQYNVFGMFLLPDELGFVLIFQAHIWINLVIVFIIFVIL